MNALELIESLVAPDRQYTNNIPHGEILRYPVVFHTDVYSNSYTTVLSVYVDHEKKQVVVDLE